MKYLIILLLLVGCDEHTRSIPVDMLEKAFYRCKINGGMHSITATHSMRGMYDDVPNPILVHVRCMNSAQFGIKKIVP